MVDQNYTRDRAYVRETERTGGGGISVLAFIVGGLVVLAGILAFVFWGDIDGSATAPATGGGDVSVSVESDASGEAAAPAADPAPAAESDSSAATTDGAAANADAEATTGN